MISFINSLKIPEGMDTGEDFELRPWQKKIIRAVYNPVWKDTCPIKKKCVGWKDCKYKSCVRVVRKAIYSVSKKNGKTPLISAIALGHLWGPEKKMNEQIYAAAYDREQAAITFRYMSQMIARDNELSTDLNVKQVKVIDNDTNGSTFKALSSEIKGKHGLSPAVLIMDELAQFGADRTFYDTLQQGRGAHLEPILWIISTQAPDDIAVLSQEIDSAIKARKPGEDFDLTVKVFFFTTPEEADPFNPESWKSSNPALGDFLNTTDMEEAARTAKNMPSAEANFRNLRLNQRIDSEAHWMSPTIWQACGATPNLEAPPEREFWGGLDLSQKNDLTAYVLAARDLEDGHYDILPFFWTPADGLREKERQDKAPYIEWRDKGLLEAVPGRTIDYAWVAQKIADTMEDFNLVAILFDRYRIDDLKDELIRIGVDCWVYGSGKGCDWDESSNLPKPPGLKLIPHGQGEKSMDVAIEKTEDLLLKEKVRHGMHPVLQWCVANARTKKGPTGLRKFDKIKSTGRIDGAVAMAMALNGAVTQEAEKESVYESRGALVL
jgi:phage terminase large subunit-like protein